MAHTRRGWWREGADGVLYSEWRRMAVSPTTATTTAFFAAPANQKVFQFKRKSSHSVLSHLCALSCNSPALAKTLRFFWPHPHIRRCERALCEMEKRSRSRPAHPELLCRVWLNFAPTFENALRARPTHRHRFYCPAGDFKRIFAPFTSSQTRIQFRCHRNQDVRSFNFKYTPKPTPRCEKREKAILRRAKSTSK